MEKSKRLYVMVGIPGSGKSTCIKNSLGILIRDYGVGKVVSRDAIRFSIVKEDEPYFSKEKEVFDIFINEIKNGLADEKINFVVADATHINQASRTKTLRALGTALKGVKVIAIVMNTDLDTCLQRNMKRTGRELVPEDAIINMYHRMTKPNVEEGFDEVWLVD